MKMIRKNKRKQNGFTIIELLSTIAIIAIISTLVITAVSSKIQEAKKYKQLQNERMIQEASLIYIKEFGSTINNWKYNNETKEKYYCISIEELINSGYLEESIIDKEAEKENFIKITQNEDNKTYETSNLFNQTDKEVECN